MKILIFITLSLCYQFIFAQCNDDFCNTNSGLFSNNIATDIEYDNMVSNAHGTIVRQPNDWKVWGEVMAANGNSLDGEAILSSITYGYQGTILKVATGSDSDWGGQLILLTTNGLYVSGVSNTVLSNQLTGAPLFSISGFVPITVNGQSNGLPIGVNPENVKMMVASRQILMITTCTGQVYSLSMISSARGNGNTGNNITWSRIMINASVPLENVIVARVNGNGTCFALTDNGQLWTWGLITYIGNNTNANSRSFATNMTLPNGNGIKMIQIGFRSSYYVIDNVGNLFSLGNNMNGQLGDNSSTERLIWVNAKNPDNSIINDAKWISTNESSNLYPATAVIKNNGVLYTAGYDNGGMIGRNNGQINFFDIPNGINPGDVILNVEVGGHFTGSIKQGSPRYGYTGHTAEGSFGVDSTTIGSQFNGFNFEIPPLIVPCEGNCLSPEVEYENTICNGQSSQFIINGEPGDIVTYNINGGSNVEIILSQSGQGVVEIQNITTNQTLNLISLSNSFQSCQIDLSITETIQVLAENNPACSNDCQDTLTISSPETMNLIIHQRHLWVIAENLFSVSGAQNVTLRAGDYVELRPNTSYNTTEVFEAYIQDCLSQPRVAQEVPIISTEVKVFPNPTNGIVQVETSNVLLSHISIQSLDGKVYFDKEINNLNTFQLDISNYSEGIYLINLSTNDGEFYSKKLIKSN